MVRTLVGYDHVAGPAGNKLVPDLATSVPAPTDGGKTYTFHLKHGRQVRPAGRAGRSPRRTSLYAFERHREPEGRRASTPSTTRRSPGFDAYGAGKAKTISGIADARTRARSSST